MIEYKDISIVSFLSSVYGIEAKARGNKYTARITGKEGYDTTIFEFDGKFKNWSTDRSGNIFDLVQMIEGCDFLRAKDIIQSYAGGDILPISKKIDRETVLKPSEPEKIKIIGNIHVSLVYYAQSRCISRTTLLKYCVQVNIGKYYHLGFKNDKDGYVLRNKFAKRNTGKSAVSTFLGNDIVNVFEGFFDFLTYKEVYPGCSESCIVLNSTSNLTRDLITKLSSFSVVKCWLDNDNAGNEALRKIKEVCVDAQDMSYKYKSHSDLNGFYIDYMKNNTKKFKNN